MRRILFRAAVLTALAGSVLAFAGTTPASAGKPVINYGQISVKPGYHLHLTSMTLGGCDGLSVALVVDNTAGSAFADNSAAGGCGAIALSDPNYQNTSNAT